MLSHSRTGSTARLRDAVLAGVADAEATARSLDVVDAGLDDVLAADGLVLCTPARFGALAGLTKDFFERIYPWFDEVPDVRPGLPYALVAKGASDASGAVRDVQRIATGLRWKEVVARRRRRGRHHRRPPRGAARGTGATLAAGLTAGLW